MKQLEIIRKSNSHNASVTSEVDDILKQILNKLPSKMLFRFKIAKKLAYWHIDQLERNMTSTGCIVISKSEKKLAIMHRWYTNLKESLDEVIGYTRKDLTYL